MNSYRAAIKDNSYSLSEKFITPSSQSSIFSQLSQPSNFAQHQQNLSPSQPISFTQFSALDTAENSLISISSQISSFLLENNADILAEARTFLEDLRTRIAKTNSEIDVQNKHDFNLFFIFFFRSILFLCLLLTCFLFFFYFWFVFMKILQYNIQSLKI